MLELTFSIFSNRSFIRKRSLSNIIAFIGRHITCQIDSKEDSSTTDFNLDSSNTNSDQQYQALLRPHPLRVKVTLIISRKHFFFIELSFNIYLLFILADHTGELLFTYFPQLNIVTVAGTLSGLKSQQR